MFLKIIGNRKKKAVTDGVLSDIELLNKYKATKDAIFVGTLFERYTHLVFGVCMKYLKNEENSKDAVMQIFESLLESLLVQEVKHFKSWLYIVARNHCLMMFRKNNHVLEDEKTIEKALEDQYDEFDYNDIFNKEIQKQDDIENLKTAIGSLNHEQKQCIMLFYINEKSYKEVVEITGFTMKQVKSFLQNGKRNLKIIILKNRINND